MVDCHHEIVKIESRLSGSAQSFHTQEQWSSTFQTRQSLVVSIGNANEAAGVSSANLLI